MFSRDEHANITDESGALARDATASLGPDVRKELSALATIARLELAQLGEPAHALQVLGYDSSLLVHVICDWPAGKKFMLAAESINMSKVTRGHSMPHSRSCVW